MLKHALIAAFALATTRGQEQRSSSSISHPPPTLSLTLTHSRLLDRTEAEVYFMPGVCQGIILTGLCIGCEWSGPITAGQAGRVPPEVLKVEGGKLVCGCPAYDGESVACDITPLSEDDLEAVKAEYGDAVTFGIGELQY